MAAVRACGAHRPRGELVRLEPKDALAALAAGTIDAALIVAPVGDERVRAALAKGARLLSIEAKALRSPFAWLRRIDGKVSGVGDVPAVRLDDVLATKSGLSVEEADEIAAAVDRFAPGWNATHPASPIASAAESAARAMLPFHRGALQHLEEVKALPYPLRVYVGVYAYSISELDLAHGTYLLDGYVWFRWKGPHLGDAPLDFTLVNGTLEHIEDSPVIHHDGVYRQSRRITARLRANFLLHDYPFDTQHLPLELEHRWMGDEKLVFVPDDEAATSGNLLSSFLSRDVKINDWIIENVRHSAVQKKYETDFGSIEKGVWAGTSSRYVFTVDIRRALIPYLVKFILPLIVIVLMNFTVFFISPEGFDLKGGIAITALLSCVAFHISQAGSLPEVGYLVRADKFFIVSYLLIFLTLVVVVAENAPRTGEQDALAARIMRMSRLLFPVLFFVAFAALLLQGRS